MKITFIVCHELRASRVMEMLQESDIDYYTRWKDATGKGRGTEPHLGTGSFGSMNTVLMIAFESEAPLERLIDKIERFNAAAVRKDERVRLFQLPLERIV
jgi:hypothetical protein